ncbi:MULTISPECIES: hypothetical protein [unclassified Lysinibacillus]|uniref:hypothetical protein n=1 Tax=unclassified Lysinibacillus TaxID=2636778 RepID=UPI00381845F5
MNRWIYTIENVHITPINLRSILNEVESEVVKIFFKEIKLQYNYEIEIKYFTQHSNKLPNYWIRLKFFLDFADMNKFTLLTLYCVDNMDYPLKIQANYLFDDLLEVKNKKDFLKKLKSIFMESFLEMNSYIEYNKEDNLLNYNSDEMYLVNTDNKLIDRNIFVKQKRCAERGAGDTLLVKKNTNEYVNRKKWTDKEKEIIINNISSYRKVFYDSDKQLVKEITKDFASNLLNQYNSVYEHRSVIAIANRLAYFDELLAGVQTHYAKIDEIYFGKLKRLDGDMTKNPARIWRN